MAETPTLSGIHHVTAITASPQANVDFYVGVLGLRLVKRTVNFDDPTSYHLYYGDALGRPGTIMTFFAWPGAPRGRVGPPQATATSFAAPAASLTFWAERLKEFNVETEVASTRFGDPVLTFLDPDGMKLEIVGVAQGASAAPAPPAPSTASGRAGAMAIPAAHALQGFHAVTLAEEGYENTAKLLTEVLGFRAESSDGNRFRYRATGGGDGFAGVVDLLCQPDARHGGMGAGVVHHVAFRTPDDAQQQAWRAEIARRGFNVSPVMDRTYFHSIYFREPGGVLFEIATDPPGFTADQPHEELGAKLMLPPWLEPHRADIERVLPPLRLP